MKKNIFYKIGFNTLIQFSGKIITVVLGFLTVGLLTRYLGTSGDGDFTLVFAYMSFFGVFADFGLQLAIVRELSQKSIRAEKIYGTYFWIKLALIVASTALALILLIFFPYSNSLKIGIVIGALAVGIGGLSGYGTAIFQSKVRLDLVTYIDILSRLVSVILIVIFIFIKLNFYYIVSTVLIGNLAAFLATIYLLKSSTLIAIFLSFFVILLGFIFAPVIVNIFGGLSFEASIVPFKILLFSLPIFFINNILYNFYLVERKVKLIIMGMFFTLAINFFLNVFFISKYSYIGAAYVTIISEVALLLFYLSVVFL